MPLNIVNKIPVDILKKSLKVNEIFYSIQGESTLAGIPCIFIRLTYCNLRCSYCDTEYAFHEGTDQTIEQIVNKIQSYNCMTVEVTGGEPLVQKNTLPLLVSLCDLKFNVLLETGGHMDIKNVDKRVKIIMDLKCPSSGEAEKNQWSNLEYLKPADEIKFVISDRNDFEWSKTIIKKYELEKKCHLLLSPVFDKLTNRQLAEWILEENLQVRIQLQIHKYIWNPEKRGV